MLTPEESYIIERMLEDSTVIDKAVEDVVKYSTKGQLARMLWWDLFNRRRKIKLIEGMLRVILLCLY